MEVEHRVVVATLHPQQITTTVQRLRQGRGAGRSPVVARERRIEMTKQAQRVAAFVMG